MSLPFKIKLCAASLGTALGALLGGGDALLYTLVCFTVADYITGVVKAVLHKTLSAEVAFGGGLKKILIYIVVAVAVGLDNVLALGDSLLRTLTVSYYIACEGLSVLENAALCGLPLPGKLRDTLANLKGDAV